MMSISANGRTGSWHTGEPMHVPDGRVVNFQVDGHELEWLREAIQAKLDNQGLVLEWPAARLTPCF